MSTPTTYTLGIFAILTILISYSAHLYVTENLSPQGCRMSWMSPSYLLQEKFDSSWTPLAKRYSLWLYREVGWDPGQGDVDSVPVLFIPGNAGSSRQVRSVASSATRQFYSSPFVVADEFKSLPVKPLDVFAVEFNEDLSAFHGPTLEAQIRYSSSAISYILSLYPPHTEIIVMGHSMGGIVATSLLPSNNISAVITMSTPYTLPPARFDARIDGLYAKVRRTLETDATPIVSLCGGATDVMIPSESCVLPSVSSNLFRRTIFTSALEGAWTGVGHREMVWCHQVRWRVARAALETGSSKSPSQRMFLLDKWLRDGHNLPPDIPTDSQSVESDIKDVWTYSVLSQHRNLLLQTPKNAKTYLLPLPRDNSSSPSVVFSVFVSGGSIGPVSPQNKIPLHISVLDCTIPSESTEVNAKCSPLKPRSLKLIPNPVPGEPFPVPGHGSDESEGVVLYEADILLSGDMQNDERYVGVQVENPDGRGWIVGGFNVEPPLNNDSGMLAALFGITVNLVLDAEETLRTSMKFPNLITNAIIAYQVTPILKNGYRCTNPLLPPIITYTSHAVETHYYPLIGLRDQRILLHTHIPAPHIPSPQVSSGGLNFTIYTSGSSGCGNALQGFYVQLDLFATMGRIATRYMITIVSWSIGVTSLVLFYAWGMDKQGVQMPTISESLITFGHKMFRYLMPVSFIFSLLPLSERYFLGNKGSLIFAPLAPLMLLVASGLVFTSWWILSIFIWFVANVSKFVLGKRREKTGIQRGTLISMCIVFILILLFIPWQVAYLGAWILQLYSCSSGRVELSSAYQSEQRALSIPLVDLSTDPADGDFNTEVYVPRQQIPQNYIIMKQNNLNHNDHILLLMTWLIPLVAPVLAVWVRTLMIAGLTTPFDGDHFFLSVAPYLILVDFASWAPGPIFDQRSSAETISVRWVFAGIAAVAFLIGSRKPYDIFNAASIGFCIIVVLRIGRRYWGGSPYFSHRI